VPGLMKKHMNDRPIDRIYLGSTRWEAIDWRAPADSAR